MTTEEKIFNAARTVFQKKGFRARMQEIADEAGINNVALLF
jgi:AcrR family transcriptional regulator